MIIAVMHEAAALASLALFAGMIAICAQVLGNLCSRRSIFPRHARIFAGHPRLGLRFAFERRGWPGPARP